MTNIPNPNVFLEDRRNYIDVTCICQAGRAVIAFIIYFTKELKIVCQDKICSR
jgi:hypothetical protein